MMPTVALDSLLPDSSRLYYADHQPNARGPALLLLHGAAGSHLVWPGPVRRLTSTRVLALDLPGHGRSAPPGRRTVAHYAAAVRAFVASAALDRFIVVGHSLGAAIALALALEAPPGLCGLVLIGASARLRVNDALLGGCFASFDRAADLIVEYGFAAAPPLLRRKTRQAILAAGPVTTFGDFLACSQFDARAQLRDIDLPALVIGGTADRLTPPHQADALAAGLPRARLARVDGAGHFVMLERPDEVARLIAGFLAGEELNTNSSAEYR